MKNTKTLAELTAGATGALALLVTRVALAAEKTAEKAAEKGSIDAKAPGSAPMESADGVAGAAGSAGSAGGAAAPAAPDPEAIRQMVETTVQNQDPTTFTIVALALGGVALVLALVLLGLHVQQNGATKRAQADLGREKKRVAALEQQLDAQASTIEGLVAAVTALKNQPAAPAPAPVRPAPVQPSAPAPAPVITDDMRWHDFVDAYNALRAKSKELAGSMALRKDRQAFQQHYGLIGLSCTNSDARMADPSVAPVFAEQALASADFWAYPMPDGSGRYAVVPTSMHPYTSEFHRQGGGAEAFASRYAGGTCQTLTVLRPAIFSRTLGEIEQKGELRLS